MENTLGSVGKFYEDVNKLKVMFKYSIFMLLLIIAGRCLIGGSTSIEWLLSLAVSASLFVSIVGCIKGSKPLLN